MFAAALFGSCPQCGAKTLFAAPAQIARKCDACRLDYAELERGGRFAGLVTIAAAAVLCMAALGLDAVIRLPLSAQLAIWAPLTVGGVLYALRLYKALLLYAAYERAAEAQDRPV